MTCTATLSGRGDLFGIGTTEVEFLAQDSFGNTATCAMTVTVNDPEKPALKCPQTLHVSTQPGTLYALVNVPVFAFDNSLQQESAASGIEE